MKKPVLIITETRTKGLGIVSESQTESIPDGCMRISGVVAKVDTINENNRIYPRAEYQRHVDSINERLADGVYGEHEHPQSVEVSWDRMSHKIEKLYIAENGDVMGQFLLLDTKYGRIAQTIAKTGGKICASSRAYGTISENNEVHLDSMITFDLVKRPGFKETNMRMSESLKPIQESKIENSDDCVSETKIYDLSEINENKATQEAAKINFDALMENKDFVSFLDKTIEKRATNSILESVNAVNEAKDEAKFADLEKRVQLRITEGIKSVSTPIEDYINEAVQNGITEMKKWSKSDLTSTILEGVDNYLNKDYGVAIEKWCKEDLATTIGEGLQSYITNDYSQIVENWSKTELTPSILEGVDNYLNKDYGVAIEKWCKSDLTKSIVEGMDNYLNQDYRAVNENKAEAKQVINTKIKDHTNSLISKIDESINAAKNSNKAKPINEPKNDVMENYLEYMPSTVKPLYESMTNEQKADIKNKASIRDLKTVEDVNEFWSNIDFVKVNDLNEHKVVQKNNSKLNPYFESVKTMMGQNFKY